MKTNKPEKQVRGSRYVVAGKFLISALAFLFPLLPPPVNGTHRVATLEETVRIADTIVHGKIVDAAAEWVEDGRGRHIYTFATVESIRYWKGGGNQRIIVEWPGGTVGRITEEVSESQPLCVGEEVVLFLNNSLRPAMGVCSKSQVVREKVYGEFGVEEVNQFLAAVADASGASKQGLILPAVDTLRKNEQTMELSTSPARRSSQPKPAGEKAVMLRSEAPLDGPVALAAWTTIKSETFEGAWPNDWTCSYNYTGPGGVGITWAPVT